MKFGKLTAILATAGTISAIAIAQDSNVLWNAVEAELTKLVGVTPLPAHPLERLEANEISDFWGVAKAMFKINMGFYEKDKSAKPDTAIAVRDAHAKGHGCVVANLEISENIPQWAQSGIFAKPGHVFPAIARFSNGTQETGHPDNEKDARGMSIKLIDPENLKTNLLGTGNTQDFLMINSPRFFIRNLHDYLLFQMSVIKTGSGKAFIYSRAIHEALGEDLDDKTVVSLITQIEALSKGAPDALKNITAIIGPERTGLLLKKLGEVKAGKAPLESVIVNEIQRVVNSSLDETYFSMSSYRLKSGTSDNLADDTAVKYIVKPVICGASDVEVEAPAGMKGPNFLRDDLIERVAKNDNCFSLSIQALGNDDIEQKRTLVEDSRLTFGTELIQVGILRIAKQDIYSTEKARYCENLSFNPWQSQAEHQPLGSMNRVRRYAVTASSIRRHFINDVKRAEPKTTTDYTSIK
jgi:hypothetical protein